MSKVLKTVGVIVGAIGAVALVLSTAGVGAVALGSALAQVGSVAGGVASIGVYHDGNSFIQERDGSLPGDRYRPSSHGRNDLAFCVESLRIAWASAGFCNAGVQSGAGNPDGPLRFAGCIPKSSELAGGSAGCVEASERLHSVASSRAGRNAAKRNSYLAGNVLRNRSAAKTAHNDNMRDGLYAGTVAISLGRA